MPSVPSSGGKDAKFEKLRKGLIAAGLVQVCQDGQVVLWGGGGGCRGAGDR